MRRRAMMSLMPMALPAVATPRDRPVPTSEEPEIVSLVQLLAAPEKVTGRVVRTAGFLFLELEGNALYLHREDFEHMVVPNSVRLALTLQQEEQWRVLSGSHVALEGRFEARSSGSRDFRSGYLRNIRGMDRIRSHAELVDLLRK
jgi:hypothetical protein